MAPLAFTGPRVIRKTFSSFLGGRATAAPAHEIGELHSPDQQNVLLDEVPGAVLTRRGAVKMGTPGSNPLNSVFLFRTATGNEEIIVSDGTTIWKTTDGANFTSLYTLASGGSDYILSGAMVRDKLWMTNGNSSQPVLTYDGTSVVELDGTGTKPNPARGKHLIFSLDRVWIANKSGNESTLYVSALFDTSGSAIAPDSQNAWPAANAINVRQNDGDQITGLIEYLGTPWIFKRRSIHRIIGSDEFSFGYLPIYQGVGCVSHRSLASVDGALHFLDITGIYRTTGGIPEKLTDLLQPDIDAITMPDLRTPFASWDTTANFDAGTHSSTSAAVKSGKLTLAPDTTNGKLTETFSDSLDDDPNWTTEAGSWSLSGGRGRPNTQGSLSQLSTPMDRAYGVWQANIIVWNVGGSGTPDVGTDPGDIPVGTVVGEVILMQDDVGSQSYLLQFSLQTTTTLRCRLKKRTGSGDTNLGSSFDISLSGANATGSAVIKVTRTTAGAFTVFKDGVSQTTATDTSITRSDKIKLRGMIYADPDTSNVLGFDDIYFPQYASSGNWTSEVKDTESPTAKTAWNIYAATQSANGQTITHQFSLDNSNPFDGSPTVAFTNITPGTKIPSAIGSMTRYLKIKISLSTANTFVTPEVDLAQVFWIVGGSSRNIPAAIGYRGRYWLAYSKSPSAYNDSILMSSKAAFVPEGQPAAWTYFTGLYVSQFEVWRDNLIGADSRGTGDGTSYVGNLLRLDYGNSDFTADGTATAIDSYWTTRDEAFEESGLDKQLMEVAVDFKKKGEYNLALAYSPNGGDNYTSNNVSLVGSGRGTASRFVTNATGKTFRVRVRTNAQGQPFEVNAIGLGVIPMRAVR